MWSLVLVACAMLTWVGFMYWLRRVFGFHHRLIDWYAAPLDWSDVRAGLAECERRKAIYESLPGPDRMMLRPWCAPESYLSESLRETVERDLAAR